MHRRTLILGLMSASCLGIRKSNAWPLATREQVRRENAAPHSQTVPIPAQSGAPTIRLEEPDITRPVRLPANIRLRFQPTVNARIVVDSLRVTYGFLRLDITRRILAHARPTPSGVYVEDVELPRGRHRVTVQVADNMGRIGSSSFEFNVV
jgi:hypothetical protein